MKKTTTKKSTQTRKQDSPAIKQLPGITELLRASWQLVTTRFGALLGIGVLNSLLQMSLVVVASMLALAAGVARAVEAYSQGTPLTELLNIELLRPVALIFLVLIIALIIESLLAQITILRVLFNPKESIMHAFRRAISSFWIVLGASLLVTFITLGGMMVFLLPGLIFSIWFMFSVFEIVLFDTPATAALERSAAVVRRHIGGILGRVAALVLITMIVGSIFDEVSRSMSADLQGVAALASLLYQALVSWIWVAFVGKLYLAVRDESLGHKNSVMVAVAVAGIGWFILVVLAASILPTILTSLPSADTIFSTIQAEMTNF